MRSILAQRLRAARQSMHPPVTQRAVAQRLRLSPSAVNLWEAGKTQPGNIVLAAVAKASPPILRRYVREAADDSRFPTHRLNDGARVLGRVVEVTVRRMV
jgi:transcriptional regulator with XRE-family HTH domain